jgi:hypothetical protein
MRVDSWNVKEGKSRIERALKPYVVCKDNDGGEPFPKTSSQIWSSV